MRGWTLICAGALLGASACGGLLIVEEPRVEGSRLARCDDSSDCDLGLVCAACDEHLCCVDSSGACGPMHPDGDCPLGQTCSNGVCVDGDTSWCDCQPEQGCEGGVCVDVDTGNECSTSNLDGVCREGHVCNGGSCVPCTENNSCAPGRPSGCCPSGAVCQADRCYVETNEDCSPTNTDGACPAGYACNEKGHCDRVACSSSEPFGACVSPGDYCNGGDCVCIPCSLDNPSGCCPDLEFCSLAGYCIQNGTCRDDYDCESGEFCSVTHVCLTSPACADPADCAAGEVCVDSVCTIGCTDDTPCGTGYHCDGTVCAVDTCASLGCAGLNRACDDTGAYAVCTTCIAGHHEDQAQSCVPDTCADANCAALNRACDESGPYAECRGCLPGYTEVDGVCSNCQLTSDCDTGYYCSAAHSCTQDCDPSTQTTCNNGRRCSPYGRCVPQVTDAGACAAGVTEGDVVEPVVMILVDQSGSMDTHYDVGTRWADLEDVLFDPASGVVKPLEDDIMFGLTLYTTGGGTCPRLRQEDYVGLEIGPKLNNHADMAALYAAQGPNGDTPTGDSIDGVVAYLNSLTLDPPRSKYILLATDGEPDRCEELNPQRGQAESIVATRNAFNQGIRTFMLSVGSDVRDDHMQDVANAGAGCQVNSYYDDAPTCDPGVPACYNKQDDVTDYSDFDPWLVRCPDDSTGTPINHPFYKATSRQDLLDGLNEIFSSVLSCNVALNATPNAPPISGNVYVDGEMIPQGPPDGWTITGPETLQFLGATCATITNGQPHFIAVEITECDFPE